MHSNFSTPGRTAPVAVNYQQIQTLTPITQPKDATVRIKQKRPGSAILPK